MGQEEGTGGTTVTASSEPEQLREQIEETRQELGNTVEALAAKTDVRAQARRRLEAARASLSGKVDELLKRARSVSPDGVGAAAAEMIEAARANPGRTVAGIAFVALLTRRIAKGLRQRRCSA